MDFACNVNTLCFELMKGVPPASVAVVVALVGGFVTWQQYRVAKAKLNLDLFERRYEIFETVWGHLSKAVQTGPSAPLSGDAGELTNVIPKTEFLFGPDLAEYIRQIHAKSTELWMIGKRTEASGDVMRQEDVERHSELMTWFANQASEGAKATFGRYLDFTEWR